MLEVFVVCFYMHMIVMRPRLCMRMREVVRGYFRHVLVPLLCACSASAAPTVYDSGFGLALHNPEHVSLSSECEEPQKTRAHVSLMCVYHRLRRSAGWLRPRLIPAVS